ncbi:MAG: isoprenyl transferase [Pseudobdellovibrionaceae bacterium]|nr:isoprenyl transferase [Pseudobdellovibrionaceae bacterium]
MSRLSQAKVPEHVAIIMDGNGRWAQGQGQARVYGHQSGAQRVRDVVEAAGNAGVKVLTLYAFSEENWRRPVDEVNALFSLLVSYLKQEIDQLHENKVRLRSIGFTDKLPADCQEWLKLVEARTEHNDGLQLVLALSYSGRSDLVRAMQRMAMAVKEGRLQPDDIQEQVVTEHLSTQGLPEPDLLIRTSGEQRLSNFLLWEMAYTEFYFTKVHWPEFSPDHLNEALREYADRDRRFGAVRMDKPVC